MKNLLLLLLPAMLIFGSCDQDAAKDDSGDEKDQTEEGTAADDAVDSKAAEAICACIGTENDNTLGEIAQVLATDVEAARTDTVLQAKFLSIMQPMSTCLESDEVKQAMVEALGLESVAELDKPENAEAIQEVILEGIKSTPCKGFQSFMTASEQARG